MNRETEDRQADRQGSAADSPSHHETTDEMPAGEPPTG